jgi:hypothetical protein
MVMPSGHKPSWHASTGSKVSIYRDFSRNEEIGYGN